VSYIKIETSTPWDEQSVMGIRCDGCGLEKTVIGVVRTASEWVTLQRVAVSEPRLWHFCSKMCLVDALQDELEQAARDLGLAL